MIDKLNYIAGFIDGEGCISIRKDGTRGKNFNYFPEIIIVNTNKEVLNWVNLIFGDVGLMYRTKFKQHTNKKDCFRLVYNHRKALIVAKAILDYLIIKREQCQIIIDFYEKTLDTEKFSLTNKLGTFFPISKEEIERREWLFQRVHKLNLKGKNNGTNNI